MDYRLYIGRTNTLKKRITEHNNGKVKATKHRRPFILIFYEGFKSKLDAIRREKYFKTTKGKKTLRLMLKESLR